MGSLVKLLFQYFESCSNICFPVQFKLCAINTTIQYEDYQAFSGHVSSRNKSNIAITTQLNGKDMDVQCPGDVLRSPYLLPL